MVRTSPYHLPQYQRASHRSVGLVGARGQGRGKAASRRRRSGDCLRPGSMPQRCRDSGCKPQGLTHQCPCSSQASRTQHEGGGDTSKKKRRNFCEKNVEKKKLVIKNSSQASKVHYAGPKKNPKKITQGQKLQFKGKAQR